MRFLLVIISFAYVLQLPLKGQRQADNWVAGICNGNGICSPPYGTTVVKFNDFSIESITNKYFNFRINKGSASISDSLGNLLLVFNGKHLFDSSGAIIDSLYLSDFDGMPVGYKSSLFLNVPGSPDKYCLFNSYANVINNPLIIEAFDSSFG